MVEIIRKKQAHIPLKKSTEKASAPKNVINLMDALRRSVQTQAKPTKAAKGKKKAKSGGKGLVENPTEFDSFKEAYRRKKFTPAAFQRNGTVGGFIGIDGGSTSTKAVLLNENGDILCKSYQLSNGNPIQDTIDMFESLRGQVEAQGAKMEVLGVATTGYAKDILKDVLKADVALVETVAHTQSALKFYDDPHVIVDVGGQDIKIIILHNGRVKDFKLNTQCSAGNGYW